MSFGQKRRQLMIFLWILLNWLLWTKNLCFWRGHTCSTWLVENSASIIFHIFIFEPWNFFTDGFAHSPRLVLDQMTLHRYCGPLSFRCQHCPHRGRGNSSHFLFHRHAPNAHADRKGWNFLSIFFLPKRLWCTSSQADLAQNPRMKKFHESAIQPHISKSNGKGKAVFPDCVEWIEFYWQQPAPANWRWNMFSTSCTNLHGLQNFWKQDKRSLPNSPWISCATRIRIHSCLTCSRLQYAASLQNKPV